MVSSLDYRGTKKGAGFDKGMGWATASFIYLTNLFTTAFMSSEFLKHLGKRSSSIALNDSAALSTFFHWGLGT
jgi:hypothetical protein